MKKILKLTCMLFTVALALNSCEKEQEDLNASQTAKKNCRKLPAKILFRLTQHLKAAQQQKVQLEQEQSLCRPILYHVLAVYAHLMVFGLREFIRFGSK